MANSSQSIRLHKDLVQLLRSCQRPGETMTRLIFRLLDTSSAIESIRDDGAARRLFNQMRHEAHLRDSLAKIGQGKD